MLAVPPDIRPDLAERYRQLRPFDEAEMALVEALVARPDRLSRPHEVILRRALNLARLWIVPGDAGDVVVGPQLSAFRDVVKRVADSIRDRTDLDPQSLAADADALEPALRREQASLLSQTLGRLSPTALEREISTKSLVLAVGGGGGCGYVHLGAFSLLESLGIRPKLVAGSSIGSILGLFRARDMDFRESTVTAVTSQLTFSSMFRVLDAETRYAMPGALRLYLRTALARYFESPQGGTMRLNDLSVPFICTVTGVRREAVRQVRHYEKLFRKELRRGALGRLLHVKDLVTNIVAFLSELVATPGAMRAVSLGSDELTRDFDVIDAVGFSSALPAIIQYDVTRDDPRMHDLMRQVLEHNDVDFLADGGIAANVPARSAWEYVQAGHIGTRNVAVLGLDCFAPQIGRNMIFLPLMRLAADNVNKDRAFANLMFTYRKTLSPTSLVPRAGALQQALRNGKEELSEKGPLLQKLLEVAAL